MIVIPSLVGALGIALGCTCAAVALPGAVELLLLVVGSVLPKRKSRFFGADRVWRIAVVVPAHNEEGNIGRTVKSLVGAERLSLEADVVVIADNCMDRTSERAREIGARVLVRTDERRGKGFALDFAFRALVSEAYDAFLVVDADTEVAANFLTEMTRWMRGGADAVQARYLLLNPNQSVRTRLTSVANRAFNVLRARGRERLGLSCGVYGNGFGMTKATLEQVPYLASSIVEDLEYHLALVRSGRQIRFVETTSVYAETPSGSGAATSQRTRWEGGRFRMIRENAPGLCIDVLRGRFGCLEPCLDLLLLPLAFHVTLLVAAAVTPVEIVRIFGLVGLGVAALHLLLAIMLADGTWREFFALLAAPVYISWKLLLLPALARGSAVNTHWVRTERNLERRVR